MNYYSIYASFRNPNNREVGKLELITASNSIKAEQLVEELGKITYELPSIQTMIKAIEYCKGYKEHELLIVIMKELVS